MELDIHIDDTSPDFIKIGRFKFPKGTEVRSASNLLLLDKEGELQALKGWLIESPTTSPRSIIILKEDLDTALFEAHEWLLKRGHLHISGVIKD